MLAMAERLSSATTVHVTSAMDARETIVERDGLSLRMPARFGVVALDEGLDDEFAPAALRDRLAFHVDLERDLRFARPKSLPLMPEEIAAARERLPSIKVGKRADRSDLHGGCGAGHRFVARATADNACGLRQRRACGSCRGRAGRHRPGRASGAGAARASVFPQAEEPEQPSEPPPDRQFGQFRSMAMTLTGRTSTERWMRLFSPRFKPRFRPMCWRRCVHRRAVREPRSQGKAGALQKSNARGRPAGVLRGDLRAGAKLNVIETLRAAAPWQPLRRREAANRAIPGCGPASSFARTISASRDSSSAARPRRSSWSMPPARRRCTGSPKPRARSNCCWRIATSGATRWR